MKIHSSTASAANVCAFLLVSNRNLLASNYETHPNLCPRGGPDVGSRRYSVGVSVDTPDSHKQFCTKEGLTFRLLADPEHKVVDQYGSLGHFGTMTIAQRNTFLIDPEGKIVRVWTKVDPQRHSEEVLQALADLKK